MPFNILFVTYGLPYPPTSGARVRDYNLILRLAHRHRVSVLALLESEDERRHMPALAEFCDHVDGVVTAGGTLRAVGRALSGLARGRPMAAAPFHEPGLYHRIRDLTAAQRFDIVQIEHSLLAPYRDAIARPFDGATVLSFHNVGVHQYRSMLAASRGLARVPAALKWWSMRGWEARAAAAFDLAVVVSGADRERLLELGAPGRISVVENGVDCARLQTLEDPPAGSQELLFVGTMGYFPNRDAARWFCREILPDIRALRPGCRLTIAGHGGREHLADLARPGIVDVTGTVEDVVPYYRRARVTIAPLRSGGGSRLKVLEATALGRPLVATRLAAEGFDLEPGRELLVADTSRAFTEAVVRLLDDADLGLRLAEAARRKVERHYDWDAVAARLEAAHLEAVSTRLRPTGVPSPTEPARRSASTDVETGRGRAASRLSVVIPVYNARDSLPLCLDALDRSQQRDFELIVIDDHSTDGSDAIAKRRCDRFIRLDRNRGQAAARNRGAREAGAPLLFFLDADVLVEPETLDAILAVFEREPGLAATFCSYQPDTPADNFVSQYKNLLHHWTHQHAAREAATFCGGFGAIRRDVFLTAGGFDEDLRFMEDVDLGYRLHQAGHRILLSPHIQLTHTKRYTLPGLVRADVMQRAVPWTRVMLRRRVFHSDLNLRPNNLASTAVLGLMALVPLLPVPVLPTELVLAIAFVALNGPFLAFLVRRRGAGFALRAVPMLALQYAYSAVGLGLGVLSFVRDRIAERGRGGTRTE